MKSTFRRGWVASLMVSGAALTLRSLPPVQAEERADLQLAAAEQAACDDWNCADPVGDCGTPVGQSGCGAAVANPYAGGICERPVLTGDWGGRRSSLASSGVTLDADNTSFYFGNTSGGLNRQFDYGGHGDYVFNVDSGKLGLMEGQFWKIRAEHRFGESISNDTGALLPATVLADLPVSTSEDVYLTNVLLTQFLSEELAVFAGKLDTFDGDANAFASGRGKTQFSNMAMVANPVALRTIPYSTLGAGFIVLFEKQPIFVFTVLNATDTTRTSGFEELFNDGAALSGFLRLPTNFFGRLGHQAVGATWSSKDFVSLGQDPRIILPDVPIARQSDSWSLFWNGDQYLVTDPSNPARGWGVFGRAGVADEDANPVAWFVSGGLGGSSTLVGRPADTFGIGWYHVGSSDELGPIIENAFGPIGDGDGVELFYNIAVTPWCHVTPDLQILRPAREAVETAVVAGVRANVNF